ncbi:MAG TPA: cob(I)yrinic acid a,c-diamide adenosyltransferase [Anaerolineales bacterium]|nr:cob(I)yrinic acid a,c-diamide adenosyltransferase [Anaerolineales bacterium]
MGKFFTGEGDDGTTGLLGPGRVPKYHPRPEAFGTVDEAAAALGLARSLTQVETTRTILETVQRDLYRLMAEVAALPETAERFRSVGPEHVAWLEDRIREIGDGLESPEGFILGGDTPGAGALDLARAVLRRAEREVARLTHSGDLVNPDLMRYLNRGSTLCFVLILAEIRSVGSTHPTMARPEIR